MRSEIVSYVDIQFHKDGKLFFFWGGGANMICFAARKLDSTKKTLRGDLFIC